MFRNRQANSFVCEVRGLSYISLSLTLRNFRLSEAGPLLLQWIMDLSSRGG